MKSDEKDLLIKGLELLGIEKDEKVIEIFSNYMYFIKQYGNELDITNLFNSNEIIVKHFLDSLSSLPILKGEGLIYSGVEILDFGSGGGFPGIPIKIVLPKIKMTLAEVSLKKIYFLEKLIEYLKIDVKTLNDLDNSDNNKYDLIVCRAVGSLGTIFKKTKKYISHGRIIAYKGRPEKASDEIGNKNWQLFNVNVPFLKEQRCIAMLTI